MRLTKLTFEALDPQTGKRYTRVLDGEDVALWNDWMIRVCQIAVAVGKSVDELRMQGIMPTEANGTFRNVAARLASLGYTIEEMDDPKWHELNWKQTEIEPSNILGEILDWK